MNYGLYLSASGLLTHNYRQDVFANNLANVNTIGFKPDLAAVQARPSESVEDSLGPDVSRKLLDRLGGGVMAAPQRISFAAGPPEPTGNPMDAFLEQPNAFFQVQSRNDAGQLENRLTRDGRFMTNDAGQLVTPKGLPVLDPAGRPIQLPPGLPTQITDQGWITDAAGNRLTQLGVVRVDDLTQLKKAGSNQFQVVGQAGIQPVDAPLVRGGTLEGSAVDPISALMQVISATKGATGNARILQYHDRTMDQAINTLGRVA